MGEEFSDFMGDTAVMGGHRAHGGPPTRENPGVCPPWPDMFKLKWLDHRRIALYD